jgi:hypothetical protein
MKSLIQFLVSYVIYARTCVRNIVIKKKVVQTHRLIYHIYATFIFLSGVFNFAGTCGSCKLTTYITNCHFLHIDMYHDQTHRSNNSA